MKSIVNETNNCNCNPYPKLMKSTNSGAIFLMKEDGEGVVIHGKTCGGLGIGTYRGRWNTTGFVDYYGSVTLSN